MQEDFFFFFCKENLCDQGSGGKFSWQKLKQMLSCFDFFPVALLASQGKRNYTPLGGQLFHVVRLGDWKKQKSASFNLASFGNRRKIK